jgi:hypothetical protein
MFWIRSGKPKITSTVYLEITNLKELFLADILFFRKLESKYVHMKTNQKL